MPDGFYFANFAQFPVCTVPLEVMHNGVTAGYFVHYALQLKANSSGYVGVTL
jgi:hypothetical protein